MEKGRKIWIALTGQRIFCTTITVGVARGYYGSGLRPGSRSQTASAFAKVSADRQVFVTTPIFWKEELKKRLVNSVPYGSAPP
jgi:hypothetical protein